MSKETGEHYIWGSNCDGWHLLKQEDLSIIHERMPPGTEEARHYHNKSRQFFFILYGKAIIEINGEIHELNQLEGIEIHPQTPHQILNRTSNDIEFLVISQPTTIGDRILVHEEKL
ncbi:cupin domain-containing protein [Tepidibacillus decaturensis]|uniref:Cupin n=1 Tax=Tepidibacillus decaturensis TaxID=1413211 RepID=A0A135L1B9_9BACI|nr:cupin domain-containing protein [Tepidibacillus decaturensis]KXG42689.1 cupin [Tepidibacillus decaturensis]